MAERTDLNLHNELVRFLAKEISVREFWNWFDAATWDGSEVPLDEEIRSVVGEIELRLAEFSNGHWTEEELREKLAPFARVYMQKDRYWGEPDSWYRTSSSNTSVLPGIIASQTAQPETPVDIEFSVEYA